MPGVAVFGITGRMGQSLVRALREEESAALAGAARPEAVLHLCGALASPDSARLGRDAALEGPACGVRSAPTPQPRSRRPPWHSISACHATSRNMRAPAPRRRFRSVGTTGFDAPSRAELEATAQVVPVLVAPNTSIGVTVMAHLLELASAALGAHYDVEISEAHHRMKRDAPSGTALALGEVVAGARGETLESLAVFDRHGALMPRRRGQHRVFRSAGRRHRRRAHGDFRDGRRAHRNDSSRLRPVDFRARRPAGGRVADRPRRRVFTACATYWAWRRALDSQRRHR